MRERKVTCLLALMAAAGLALSARAETPWPVESLRGLPIIGDANAAIGEVDDVLIGADGQIAAIVADAQAKGEIHDRVAIPWPDVSIDSEPLQVSLKRSGGNGFSPYPGAPAGTRQEKESYSTEYDVDPVVVIDRP